MTLRDLSEGLRELADDVQPVDLHARAIRTSRRLRARRAAAVMSGAMAFVLVIVVGVSLSWHRTGGNDDGGGMDTADSVIADASDSASPYGDGDEDGESFSILARVGFYVKPTSADVYGVYSWAPGSEPRLEISGPEDFAASVEVSPNGQYAAYYSLGSMYVTEITADDPAEPGDIVYSAEVPGEDCLPPSWAPDSSAVVLNARDSKSSTLVELSGGAASATELYRPPGCEARVFTYGSDAALAYAYTYDDGKVGWEDADDGTELRDPVGYDTADLPVAVGRISDVSADGTVVCLARPPDDEVPGSRSVCSALATPIEFGPEIPVEGVLEGASFLDAAAIDAGGGDPPDEELTGKEVSTLGVMLRMREPGGEFVVAEAMFQTVETDPGTFGGHRIDSIELAEPPLSEPPELSDAYLLTFAM